MMTTTAPSTVSDRQQIYFNKKLLARVTEELRMAQFAMPGELGKNLGTKTVRYFRRKEASTDAVIELTEGVPPTTFRTIEYDKVDVELKQFGEIAKASDVQTDIDIFNLVNDAMTAMGEDAALHADSRIRNVVMAGLLNSDAIRSERFSGVAGTGDSSVDFATLHGLSAANGKATRAHFLGCATRLKNNKAPKINGAYVALVAPDVVYDLRQDATILAAWQNKDTNRLYKDELGMMDGVRFVEHTNPWREGATYGTYASDGANHTSLVFGREAFGAPKLSRSKSPHKPQVIVHSKPDKSDPLNQFCIVAWKLMWEALLLNPRFIVALRSKSTFA